MNWYTLLRVVNQEATAEERRQVEDWLQESAANRVMYKQLQQQRSQLLFPVSEADHDKAWERIEQHMAEQPLREAPVRKLSLQKWWWVAAILLCCAISATWFVATRRSAPAILAFNTTEGKKLVTLPDGSRVWLNYRSQLSFDSLSYNAETRTVSLQGAAFFDIRKDPSHPFFVQTPYMKVKVLGTSFYVQSRQERSQQVTVATGKVNVRTKAGSLNLLPDQQLYYDTLLQAMHVNYVPTLHGTRDFQDQLVFEHADLPQVMQVLGSWYGKPVVAQGQWRKPVSFSGVLNDTGLPNVLNELCFSTGMTYALHGDSIILQPHHP